MKTKDFFAKLSHEAVNNELPPADIDIRVRMKVNHEKYEIKFWTEAYLSYGEKNFMKCKAESMFPEDIYDQILEEVSQKYAETNSKMTLDAMIEAINDGTVH